MPNTMKEPVLYIDDEIANLNSFRMALGMHYKIHLAHTVGEAFRILEKEKIKVLISDHRMPEMSGLEFIKSARKTYPEIIYIILTAYSDASVTLQALNQGGIYRFILKPWDKEEMKQALNNALDKYHLMAENRVLIDELTNKNQELEAYTEELLTTTFALRETNEKLRQAKEKAEESDRLKSAFLANMSHEIRTPMNGIVGFSEMLKLPDLQKTQIDKYVDIIQKSSTQLLSIVNDVLDISRIETGQLEIKQEKLPLNQLLTDIFGFFLPQAEEKKLTLKVSELEEESTILADETKLKQVISNLLSNAIKFTHEGHVHFGCQFKNGNVLFFVEDSGIGIDGKNHQYIFERFRQVDTTLTKTYGGAGLGLSITKALVEKMDGRIWLNSKLGKGTTFYFTIPAETIAE